MSTIQVGNPIFVERSIVWPYPLLYWEDLDQSFDCQPPQQHLRPSIINFVCFLYVLGDKHLIRFELAYDNPSPHVQVGLGGLTTHS